MLKMRRGVILSSDKGALGVEVIFCFFIWVLVTQRGSLCKTHIELCTQQFVLVSAYLLDCNKKVQKIKAGEKICC